MSAANPWSCEVIHGWLSAHPEYIQHTFNGQNMKKKKTIIKQTRLKLYPITTLCLLLTAPKFWELLLWEFEPDYWCHSEKPWFNAALWICEERSIRKSFWGGRHTEGSRQVLGVPVTCSLLPVTYLHTHTCTYTHTQTHTPLPWHTHPLFAQRGPRLGADSPPAVTEMPVSPAALQRGGGRKEGKAEETGRREEGRGGSKGKRDKGVREGGG